MTRELKKFSDKVVGKAVIQKEITEDMVDTIVGGWIEDGGYSMLRAYSKDSDFKESGKSETMYWSQYATDILLEGKALVVTDVADEGENKKYELTLEKLMQGVSKNADKRTWDNFFNDSHDAETYDCIIQYAIFDKLIYG